MTDAATAKEISIPPEIRTTRSPTAKITLMDIELSRSKAFTSVKYCTDSMDSTVEVAIIIMRSQASIGCVLNIFSVGML